MTTTTDKFERAAHHLMEMMQAYERRVRTDCTPEQIDKRPWECAEYVSAAHFLRATWPLQKPKVMICGVDCHPGAEPSEICHDCAHSLVDELRARVAEAVRMIEGYKRAGWLTNPAAIEQAGDFISRASDNEGEQRNG